MKTTAPNRAIKTRAKTLAEFKNVVRDAHLNARAVATLCDKKHCVISEQMNIGSYMEACVLCEKHGIKMISYQAIYDKPPKEVHFRTLWEYYR